MGTERVIALGDLHGGHFGGLTPPKWHMSARRSPAIARLQRETWDWFVSKLQNARPKLLVVNADCIDGRGERSGGTELITGDREEQCDIATTALKLINAKNIIMTYGTPYHTGQEEDFENLIARELGCHIGAHVWPEVNGLVFDVKHKIGGSQTPHGRHTATARDSLWNSLWARNGEQPKADVIVRSHVHYYSYCGSSSWLAMTLPALQAASTKFGGRQCSGTVDFGYVDFTVNTKGEYVWHPELLHVKNTVAKVVKF